MAFVFFDIFSCVFLQHTSQYTMGHYSCKYLSFQCNASDDSLCNEEMEWNIVTVEKLITTLMNTKMIALRTMDSIENLDYYDSSESSSYSFKGGREKDLSSRRYVYIMDYIIIHCLSSNWIIILERASRLDMLSSTNSVFGVLEFLISSFFFLISLYEN